MERMYDIGDFVRVVRSGEEGEVVELYANDSLEGVDVCVRHLEPLRYAWYGEEELCLLTCVEDFNENNISERTDRK